MLVPSLSQGSPPNWDGTKSWSPKPGSSNGEFLYPYIDPAEQIGAQGTVMTKEQASTQPSIVVCAVSIFKCCAGALNCNMYADVVRVL